MNKSVVDSMSTDNALNAVCRLLKNERISTLDASEIVKHLMRRADFTVFQIQRLQSGIDCPALLSAAVCLVVADREMNQAIKQLTGE